MMRAVKLDPFGVEITDIDLRRERSPSESRELLDLFNAHYLLVFRGQDLSDDDHLRVFHDLFPGAELGDETGTGSQISYVSNVRPDGLFGDGPLTFHSDFAFTTNPTRLISLYGWEVEPGSSPTEFSNGELALAALPEDLRNYLESKEVVSATDLFSSNARLPSFNLPGMEDLSGRTHAEVVRAAWPVILTHPRTGRPLVYVSEMHAHHFRGVPLAESREVLGTLHEYLYRPAHIYSHDWRQGDLVLWDNIALAHGRQSTAPSSAKRTLRRVRSGGATRPTMVALSQSGLEDSGQPSSEPQLASMANAHRRDLGKRIRQIRMDRGMTELELAAASSVPYSTLTMCEVGHVLPKPAELDALARALGVDSLEVVD